MLEQCKGWDANSHAVENLHITFDFLKRLSLLLVSTRGLVSGLPWIPKFADVQVSYIKWGRTMHTVGPSHQWIPKLGSKIPFAIHSWLNLQLWNPEIWRAVCV